MNHRIVPEKDERDRQTEEGSRSLTLDIVVSVSQILTLLCLIRGSSAWKLTLSILFFGAAASLFFRRRKFGKKFPHILAGLFFALVGIGLVLWFFLV